MTLDSIILLSRPILEQEPSNIPPSMDLSSIGTRTERLRQQRELLVHLLGRSDLGELRLDVTQALDELDDLLRELDAALAA